LQEKEIMKILKKSTLILLLVALIGCSKDDSPTPERSFAELTGIWEVKSYEYEGTTAYRAINTNEAWNTSYHGAGWLLNFEMSISESPNNYSFDGDHNVDHYFTDENGQEYFYFANLIRNESGTYTRNSNTGLTFNENGDYKQVTIQELNETTLKFRTSESSSETNSDNVLVSKTRIETYILERIN
jgi:hypothetical protein